MLPLAFGVFDHLDNKNVPLQQLYEERLQLIEHYDRHGMFAYHLAEHHGTPLGMAPSPGLFLSAVAQRTKNLRFGPLVYVLPLYHPMRLACEVCMLDHLSGGRLELGVGKGISAFEVALFNLSHLETQESFEEALELLTAALTSSRVRQRGQFFKVPGFPMVLKPLQQPHPPLWYGVGSASGAIWAANHHANIVSNASCEPTREAVSAYLQATEKTPLQGGRAPKMGIARHLLVAETDSEAERIASRAIAAWYSNLSALWRANGGLPTRYSADLGAMKRMDLLVCGSPATVRAEVERQIAATGCNYFVARFAYGDLSLQESLRSFDLFATEVIPHFVRRP